MISGASVVGKQKRLPSKDMTEAKNVKAQFFVTKKFKILAIARFSLFNALPSKRRLSSRIFYDCLVIRLSLLSASLPAPLKTKLFPYMLVPVMGHLLLKYH